MTSTTAEQRMVGGAPRLVVVIEMVRPVLLFVTLLTSALTMGTEFAHVLEWGPKAGYSPTLYVRLQESLYLWFGDVGGVIYVLAVLTGVVLAALTARQPGLRILTGTAAALQVAALATFFAVVYPVNFRFPVHGSGAVPSGWAALRDRWEAGHTIGFVLFAAAFVVLLLVAFRSGPALRRRGSAAVGPNGTVDQDSTDPIGHGEADGAGPELGAEPDSAR